MNSKLKILLILMFLSLSAFCLTLDEIKEPKGMMGKISNSSKVELNLKDKIEIKVNEEKKENLKEENVVKVNAINNDTKQGETLKQEEKTMFTNTYADLSLKKIANELAFELTDDETQISSDLSVLWQATTERSETMKYTIYKLSNPDEDKPTDSAIKKILKPIANISSLAGASVSGNPFVATSALIGGGLVNAFMKDDKEVNYQFSKISDADMVLLVRKIDTLQKKLIDLYVDFKTKEELCNLEQENLKKREEIYKNSQNKSKEELIIADVNYRNSKIKVQKANDEYLTSRAILENLVGKDALEKITRNK